MSLGLRLYLAAARRAGKARDADTAKRMARPTGQLIWLHISGAQDVGFVQGLIQQFSEDLIDVSFLITSPVGVAGEIAFQERCDQPCLHITAPADTPQAVAKFLGHWQPSVAIWAGSYLRPALIVETGSRAIPLLLLNAQTRASIKGQPRLGKGIIRSTLGLFDHILASHESVKIQLVSQGASARKITISGHIDNNPPPLFCDDRDRDDMAQTLAARPVWLAAYTAKSEDKLIANAHRAATRLSHRLLLILAPKDPARGAALAKSLANDGWLVARRSLDQEPDEHVQIYIADTCDEMGLWFRIAPVCFMGNSLGQDAKGCSPWAASTLGSAILHGPNIGDFKSQYARLGRVNAAREVRDEVELANAVQDLLAPDKAATMAHAGWEVTTSGAEAMERTMALIYDTLNIREAL